MKLVVIAALAAVIVSSVDALTFPPPMPPNCGSSIVSPWVTDDAGQGLACKQATGFSGKDLASATQAVATAFCSATPCRALLATVLAARPTKPPTGASEFDDDCIVRTPSGLDHLFYRYIVLDIANVCEKVTPPPTTTLSPSTKPVVVPARPQC